MNKLYDRIYWHNNTTPALNETNLNSMSKAIDDIDDRVVEIAGDIMTTIPQLEEDLETAQELIEDLEGLNEHTPYIGANGNWWVWNTTTKEYEDSGVDASISVQIADITMLAPSATPYVTNTGTSTDPIFHLFIPRGTGVQSVAKTSTSGLTDTYTMTFTDSTTYTYSVVNGKGISSISKTSTSGLVDTYTITYNDNTTTTFTVTNGKTAYQAAQEAGYSGTESEFNTMLASVQTYATSASQSASAAEDSAEDAEAWAVGTRDGSPVPSTDPTYHNNAKYWSDEAQHTTTLDGLSDVTITSPQNNDALVYDSTTQSWKNGSGGGGASTMSDLTDTAIASPTTGQILQYSSVNKWTNVSLPSVPKMVPGVTAVTGATSCTITDDAISSDSLIEVFTENVSNTPLIPPTVSVSGHTATLAFDALAETTIFYLRVSNFTSNGKKVTVVNKGDYTGADITVLMVIGSPAVNPPSVEGYTFDGYYTDASCTTEFTGNVTDSTNTLYAKWEASGPYITMSASGVITMAGLTAEENLQAQYATKVFISSGTDLNNLADGSYTSDTSQWSASTGGTLIVTLGSDFMEYYGGKSTTATMELTNGSRYSDTVVLNS